MNLLKDIKVIVGLSGGVDSSVAALLLKRAGFDVRGVYLKCYWTYEGCSSDQDRNSAARVASVLNIPFEVWDFEKEYRKTVVEYFFEEYKKGRTPNPDVVCNREIKFGLFLRKALGLSWDSVTTQRLAQGVPPCPPDKGSSSTLAFEHNLVQRKLDLDSFPKNISHGPQSTNLIATGHYARLGVRIQRSKIKDQNDQEEIIFPRFSQYEDVVDSSGVRYVGIGEYLEGVEETKKLSNEESGKRGELGLFGGVDSKKDQSYFLYDMPLTAYEHILYPLGNLTKKQVREIAKKENLPTAGRPDSSGICFIGEVNIEKFLKERIKEHEGNVVTRQGEIIGKHKGVEFYTIGQRHGFNIGKGSGQTHDSLKESPDVPRTSVPPATFAVSQTLRPSSQLPASTRLPYYVIGKNLEKNELVVGMGEECKTQKFSVKISGKSEIRIPKSEIFVRIRNLGEMIPCRVAYTEAGSGTFHDSLKESSVRPDTDGTPSTLAVKHTLTGNGDADTVSFQLLVNLAYSVFGVAPGQSAVFYRKWVEGEILRSEELRMTGGEKLGMTGMDVWQVVGGGVIQ